MGVITIPGEEIRPWLVLLLGLLERHRRQRRAWRWLECVQRQLEHGSRVRNKEPQHVAMAEWLGRRVAGPPLTRNLSRRCTPLASIRSVSGKSVTTLPSPRQTPRGGSALAAPSAPTTSVDSTRKVVAAVRRSSACRREMKGDIIVRSLHGRRPAVSFPPGASARLTHIASLRNVTSHTPVAAASPLSAGPESADGTAVGGSTSRVAAVTMIV